MSGKWARALYHPNLPLYGDTRVTAGQAHIRISKEAAKEGMVLLKNIPPAPAKGSVCAPNPLLPLPAGSRIALLGKGTFDYVKGGGGSGDVTVPYVKNLYDGFREHTDLVSVYEPAADFYRRYVQDQYRLGGVPGMIAEPALPDELLRGAAACCDTAVISFSRYSAEGWDRKSVFGAPGPASHPSDIALMNLQNRLFAQSDFYLTAAEQALLDAVTAAFARVVIVLNVGGMVATDYIRDNDRIQAALLVFQGGLEGGPAAAELLLGLGNPSGKLSDTFARRLEDYPGVETFHESDDYVAYTEDIYVGYRYFETIPGAAGRVVYPFGYGLSYTAFACQDISVSGERTDGDVPFPRVTVRVRVTNTGPRAGKEVLQLYGSAPQGRLGKPARVLCAYQKTRLLQPGETQLLQLSCSGEELASYDDTGLVRRSAWVLEEGTYRFYLGTDVRSAAALDYTVQLTDDCVLRQLTARMTPSRLPKRLHSDGTWEILPDADAASGGADNAADADGTGPAAAGQPAAEYPGAKLPDTAQHDTGNDAIEYPRLESRVPASRYVPASYLAWTRTGDSKPQLIDVAEGRLPLDAFLGDLPDVVLAELVGGQPNAGVANTYGYGNIREYGIPNILTADGPAGLRVEEETGVTTTAFPCATLLACTWNPDITYAVGRAGAEEIKENNLGVWLTPAVNIHRNPLCGRNFEYYSEDPLLTARQAGAMVRGIQGCGVAATVKHLALNNKETNRKNSDSRVSERAIREIYLRQFEYIVRDAHPWSIMSSYNTINGQRASECSDLLKGILREEWGWDGMITTDWWTNGQHHVECAAGNDMKMGSGFPEQLMEAMGRGLLTREDLLTAARHILTLILRVE